MINRPFIYSAITAAMIVFSGNTFAQEQQEVRGSQLMTEQEHLQHREKMLNAKTLEERRAIQKANHELMRTRAEARGLKLRERPAMKPRAGRGGSLLSEQEWRDHYTRMANAQTAEERRQIQDAHRKLMRARVEKRGMKPRSRPVNPRRGGGNPLLSEQEWRDHYNRMENAKTAEERRQFQDEHRKLMRARVEERGMKPRSRPVNPRRGGGKPLLSEQEWRDHYNRMDNAKTTEERRQIQDAHREQMRSRIEERRQKDRERINAEDVSKAEDSTKSAPAETTAPAEKKSEGK